MPKQSSKQQKYQQSTENERLKAQIALQEANLVDLQSKLDDKTAKLNEIKEKYDEACRIHVQWVEGQYEQHSHLKVAYAMNRLKLGDMLAKLGNSSIKNAQLKQNFLYMKEEKGKLQNKFDKKNDRISELVGKLQNIETENTELKESLKIQENKINQLESVLSRPGITAALMRATADNNDQRETEHNNDEIIPTVSISPFGSSSRSFSPRQDKDTIQAQLSVPSFGNASVVNSSGQRECSQSGSQNLRELINGSAQFNVEQNISSNIDEPPQRGQRKRRRLV